MKLTTKKIIKPVLLVIAVFCLTVVIINTKPFDEKLLPPVKEILKEKPFPPVEGNAWFAALGITENHGKDITQTGLQMTKYLIENQKKGINKLTVEQLKEFFPINSKLDLFWDVPVVTCDMSYKFDCLSKNYEGFYDQNFNSQINQPRLQLLLQRFEEVLEMNTYIAYFESAIAVDFIAFSDLRKLGEIQLINKFKNYSSHEFLNQLYKDIKFWKMVLSTGDFLIDKMVAYSQIKRDVLHLSEFLRTHEVNNNELTVINKILQPLSNQDKDLSTAFRTEANFILNSYYLMEKNASLFSNLFYQPNATSNGYYKNNLKSQQSISTMPLNQLIAYRQQDPIKSSVNLKFHYIYNFIGKVLNNYSRCNCDDYIARAHDTANMMKLVEIQLQVKQATNESFTEILAKPKNLNPYDNKPFTINKEQRVIEFECLDKFQECRVKL